MNTFETLVQAAANRDALKLRELTLEFLDAHAALENVAQPGFTDLKHLVIAAGLLDLFAARRGQRAPTWVAEVSSVEPFFLVAAAERMPRLRALCEAEAPPELKKRGLFAPPNFLEFA
jgi:hypothetical protein